MKLATHIESERGKAITKTANEFIFQEFTVKKVPVGQIELYYFNDSVDDPKNAELGEWLIKFRPIAFGGEDQEDIDWQIIAQGNI